jgi:hypothetical protein
MEYLMSTTLRVPAVGNHSTIQIKVQGECSQRVIDAFDGTLAHAAHTQKSLITPSKNPHKTWSKQEKIAYADCIRQYNLTAGVSDARPHHTGGTWVAGALVLSWIQAAGAQLTPTLHIPDYGTHDDAPAALSDTITGDLDIFRKQLAGWTPTAIQEAFDAAGGPREALQGLGLSDAQIANIGAAFVAGGKQVVGLMSDWAFLPGTAFYNAVANAAPNAATLAKLQAAVTWPVVQVAVNATSLCMNAGVQGSRALNGCLRVFTPKSLINASSALVTWAQGNLTTTTQTAGLAYQIVGGAGYPVLHETWEAGRNHDNGGDGGGRDWTTPLIIGGGVVGGMILVALGTAYCITQRKERRAAIKTQMVESTNAVNIASDV